MKHLKLFDDLASYKAWKNNEDRVTPNVVFSEETGVVYEAVNIPIVLKAKFYASDSVYYPASFLCYSNGINVKKLVVDGEEIVDDNGDAPLSYTFDTTGERYVEITLSDGTISPYMFAESCIEEIDLGDQITYIGDEAFKGCKAQSTSRFGGCKYIKCSSKIAPALGENVFTYINKSDTSQHCIVEVPEGADYNSWYEDAHSNDSTQRVSFRIHDKGGILWIGQKQELAESIFNYFDEICKRYNVSEDDINRGRLNLYTTVVTDNYQHDQIPGTIGLYNYGEVDGEWKEWVDVIGNVADDEMFKNVIDKIYY